MKKLAPFFILLAFLNTKAQELNLPAFTQYLADNPFVISPVYAGIGDHVKIRANGLAQWVGIKDAPKNMSLAADMRIADRSGVGVYFYNDRNGNTRQTGAKLSFAHHLVIDKYEDQYLSFGISYNLNQFRIEIENFTGQDMAVVDDRRLNNHNIDVGTLYRVNGFYVSATVANLLDKNIDVFNDIEPLELRNYQLFTGYKWRSMSNSDFEVEPSLFFQYFESDKRSTTDLNLKMRFYNFEDYYWAGVTYRFLNDQMLEPLNIGPMAGLKKKNFYFAYSYQITLNKLINYNSGTHMITVGLDVFQGISNCPCTF
ncbi:type IX secretion system membrane protein PorP/SprF [Flavobacterium sp.]|uniref:PorP/SprF family type IX secretion system membrane protein n=1 Tax=Flavobacterium sp. TaxID=239 RepID=UPI0026352452|nr:type IX secretion system membrane protein PorP/SprF [Flavobacterium sp.]MDD2984895.1 type IX secretion system membrane protein PorP/SprF [Flavobacterium sp.]